MQNPPAETLRELLIGRKVVSVTHTVPGRLVLDDGTILEVHGNEGCGGCGNGWYSITSLNRVENVITNVETDYSGDEDGPFRVFVFAQDEKFLLLQADGYDNGWYGTGYWLEIIRP